jgi:membrane-associated HD superfamily phosphohydrolase
MKQYELKESSDTTPPSEGAFRYTGPKPRTKEAAIVMLADSIESAVRSLSEATPTKIEAVVHNMAMKRLQDGQFDECDLTLRELSRIEASMSKTLAAHYHGRIAYPKPPEMPAEEA